MKPLFIASLLVGLTAPAFATADVSKVSYKGKGISHLTQSAKNHAPKAASFKPAPYVKR